MCQSKSETLAKDFRFHVTRRKAQAEEMGVPQDIHITLSMTQEQFEDFQFRKSAVHEKLATLGYTKEDAPYWREDPPVTAGLIEKLRAAIGAHAFTQFTADYPHSYHHRSYKEVIVEGIKYRWLSFSSNSFIHFAPAMASA